MRFASLGSGSEGNALLVESGCTRLLIDCGFGIREGVRRLGRLGVTPETLSAILVTHEHSDHIGGVAKLARRYDVPVWLTFGTFRAVESAFEEVSCRNFDTGERFCIGDIEVCPFAVPHDAVEPVQYVVGNGKIRLGVLTDIGCSTPHVESMLSGCDALVLECNHDRQMLAHSSYPHALKRRIGGRFGHLDNDAAAALLSKLDCSKLQHVVAAHLSQQNNTPDLARHALATVLGCMPEWVGIADQANGFDWRQIS